MEKIWPSYWHGFRRPKLGCQGVRSENKAALRAGAKIATPKATNSIGAIHCATAMRRPAKEQRVPRPISLLLRVQEKPLKDRASARPKSGLPREHHRDRKQR